MPFREVGSVLNSAARNATEGRSLQSAFVRLVALTLLVALAGCGQSDRASVSGRIVIDGQPLESGAINFLPAGVTRGPSAGAVVTQGQYTIEAARGVTIGENLIQIRGSGKTGRMIPNPVGPGQIEEWGERVPARFNTQSQLTRQVAPGHNALDFELTSK